MENNAFRYIYSNISLYQFDANWTSALIAIVWGIVLIGLVYSMIRLWALYSIGYHADRALTHKKKTLSDLILMKDIQTELEKEIEKAILKAAFHS